MLKINIQKCCIKDCDITATPLLIHIERTDLRLSVCTQHSDNLGQLLQNNGPIDSFPNDNESIEAMNCLLCTDQAEVKITTYTNRSETYLCKEHSQKFLHRQLDSEDQKKLFQSHLEIALHLNCSSML